MQGPWVQPRAHVRTLLMKIRMVKYHIHILSWTDSLFKMKDQKFPQAKDYISVKQTSQWQLLSCPYVFSCLNGGRQTCLESFAKVINLQHKKKLKE